MIKSTSSRLSVIQNPSCPSTADLTLSELASPSARNFFPENIPSLRLGSVGNLLPLATGCSTSRCRASNVAGIPAVATLVNGCLRESSLGFTAKEFARLKFESTLPFSALFSLGFGFVGDDGVCPWLERSRCLEGLRLSFPSTTSNPLGPRRFSHSLRVSWGTRFLTDAISSSAGSMLRGWVNGRDDEGGGVARGEVSCGGGEEDLGGAGTPPTSVGPEKQDTGSNSRVASFGSGRGFVTK